MTQAYKKVIDILLNDKIDYKAICIRIAKENPELFLSLINPDEPVILSVLNIHQARHILETIRDNKIESVKNLRNYTNLSLKESLDIINYVRYNRNIDNQFYGTPHESIRDISDDLLKMFDYDQS